MVDAGHVARIDLAKIGQTQMSATGSKKNARFTLTLVHVTTMALLRFPLVL